MSGSRNLAIILGNVGADPEVHTSESGVKIVSFSVATSERWTDKGSGEKKERTEWHRVVAFGSRDNDGLAGIAEKYLKKGSKVYVEGKLQTRKWTKDGTDHYTTEIVLQGFSANLTLLDGKEGAGNRPPPANDPSEYGRTRDAGSSSSSSSGGFSDDDTIPF
jgi:single-strand DNA-binding protein